MVINYLLDNLSLSIKDGYYPRHIEYWIGIQILKIDIDNLSNIEFYFLKKTYLMIMKKLNNWPTLEEINMCLQNSCPCH